VSYQSLWVVTFSHPSDPDAEPHVVGPFPDIEPAQDFDRHLRASWPTGDEPNIAVVQVEAPDPISDLLGER
jgi:hypothetical protein